MSEVGWTNGRYVALAIGTSFSKGKRYPNEPDVIFDMSHEHTEEHELTDADRFWAFAQAFNKQAESKSDTEITGSEIPEIPNIENTETLSDDISW